LDFATKNANVTVGLYKLKSVAHSLKAPAFNVQTINGHLLQFLSTGFQNLLSTFNSYRCVTAAMFAAMEGQAECLNALRWGLYKLTHSVKATGFNPCGAYKVKIWFQSFAFKFNLHRLRCGTRGRIWSCRETRMARRRCRCTGTASPRR
jgi:hypothetical protein